MSLYTGDLYFSISQTVPYNAHSLNIPNHRLYITCITLNNTYVRTAKFAYSLMRTHKIYIDLQLQTCEAAAPIFIIDSNHPLI
jgi:hypothetical protein